ncbi:phage integrase SAM-like domain-containing protein [Halpernia frigidisoli]|nr:phage integrase SAM-like domain-containing protein [Halpernia frigidisoli]
MATLKFILQSKNGNAPIYARLSVSKFQTIKRKTRETINPDKWEAKKGAPKNIKSGTAETIKDLENLKQKLSAIESFVLNAYNQRNETEIINGDWLSEILEAFYNGGRKIEKLDFLPNYLDYYETYILPFRKYKGSPIAYRTKQKQITIISKLKSFLQTLNKNVRVSDYGESMGNEFVTYLRIVDNLNENTVGKYLKYSKTIIKDAYKIDIQTNSNIDQIKGFTVETPTVIFTPEELETIQKLIFLNVKWEITRDWLIIGCYTGQRAGDLFSMKKEMITKDQNEREFINLTQAKVKARVKIPIGKEVKKILEKYKGNFPPVYSQSLESNKTIFNKYLKQITERAGIDRLDKGRIYDKEQKKYIFGMYPLHKLVSSHLCRRTFATMYYGKIATPIIMSVTKHKTETEFLKYIGKDSDELTSQMFDYWDKLETEKTEQENKELKNVN